MPSIPKPDAATLAALAAAGYPDPGPPPGTDKTDKKDSLLDEGFPALLGSAGTMAVGALEAARGIADAATTKGSISQYLIGSGGAAQSNDAPMNAVVSALNRLAGFKSRL